jgi:hypothetical protein
MENRTWCVFAEEPNGTYLVGSGRDRQEAEEVREQLRHWTGYEGKQLTVASVPTDAIDWDLAEQDIPQRFS